MIAVDIETIDPNLHALGDGALRKDGEILCVGLYDGKDAVCVTPDDPRLAAWLAQDEDKIFHNGIYDLSWLVLGYGLKVNGRIHDTMTRAALIYEFDDKYDLDSCCKRLHVEGKNFADTLEIWAKANGVKNVFKQLREIWATEEGRRRVCAYCIQDCVAAFNLYEAQEKLIKEYDLTEAAETESGLYPLLLDMKRNGLKVDLAARDRLKEVKEAEISASLAALEAEYGIKETMLRSPKQMMKAMNALGVHSPVITPSGLESFGEEAYNLISHPVVELLRKAKRGMSYYNTFLLGNFGKFVIGDRIHPTLYPTKRDDGGAVTSRFSCKNPNMQNLPYLKDKEGKIRSLILADRGEMLGSFDYAQIEYVMLANYAVGPKSDYVRELAWKRVDFHSIAQELTGQSNRTLVKNFNFGAIYGMGLEGMKKGSSRPVFMENAAKAGVDFDTYAKRLYDSYFEGMPFVRPTMKYIENTVRNQGWFRSVGGRRHNKPKGKWLNGKWNDKMYVCTNHVLQSSAAEVIKRAMLDAWNKGLFNILKARLMVHDELVVGIPYNREGTEAAMELQYVMEHAYEDRLKVPLTVAGEVGPNWGYWSDDIWKNMQQGVFTVV
jgi:DNA polymerase-1